MAFDGIETAIANDILIRRLSRVEDSHLSIDLKEKGSPEIAALTKELEQEPLLHCLANPLGAHFLHRFLRKHCTGLALSFPLVDDIEAFEVQATENDAVALQRAARELFENQLQFLLRMEETKEPEAEVGSSEHLSLGVAHGRSSSVCKTDFKFTNFISLDVLHEIKAVIDANKAGPQLFSPVLAAANDALQTGYSEFLKHETFVEYVQHVEYSRRFRGHISTESFDGFRPVGVGAFGMVTVVEKKDTGMIYAMKELSKKQVKAHRHHSLVVNECRILALLKDTPFVTHLRYAFQNEDKLFIVMDFCAGGDLNYHLKNQEKDRYTKTRHFPLPIARFYAAELILALEHVHSLNIVYRDLKPRNVLLESSGHVALSDFGLAEELNMHGTTTSYGGTPGYWAPEVLTGTPYGVQADVWSLGVMMYELMLGKKPKCSCKRKEGEWCTWIHSRPEEQRKNAEAKGLDAFVLRLQYPPEVFSPEAKDLLQRCLEPCVDKRITLAEMKRHRFFAGLPWFKLLHRKVDPPFIPDSDVNAGTLDEVGQLNTHKYRKVVLDEEDARLFAEFDFYKDYVVSEELVEARQRSVDRMGTVTMPAYATKDAEFDLPHTSKCCALL